jgi:L-fuculose-phosphate aldolase
MLATSHAHDLTPTAATTATTAAAEPAQLVALGSRVLAKAGQGDMVWGHLALRDPDGRGVWTKSAGWGREEINSERVLLISWDGDVLAGTGHPHLECQIHTAR